MTFLEELESTVYYKSKMLAGFIDNYVIESSVHENIGLKNFTYERWVLLGMVIDEPGLSIGKYAQKLNKNISTLSNTFKYFEKNGLISKKPSRSVRGAYEVNATKKAQEAVEIVSNIHRTGMDYVHSKFDDAELDTLKQLLDKYTKHTHEIGKKLVANN